MSGNLTNANLEFSQERQEETLNQISKLQELERAQYDKLVKESGEEGNPQEVQAIVEEINKLSEIRANLFKTLTDMYSQMQNNVAGTRVNLVNQLTLVETAEEQLNQAREELLDVRAARDNKMRMVEINTYYGKRYKAHTSLMKVLIMVLVPILILAILNKKGFLSYEVTRMLATLVGLVGAYFVISRVFDLMSRDNMEYDAINWGGTGAASGVANPPSVWDYNKQKWNEFINGPGSNTFGELERSLGIKCYGEACCNDNMRYNKQLRKCEYKVLEVKIPNEVLDVKISNEPKEGFRNKGKAPNYVSRDYCEYGDRSTVRAFDPESASFARV